MARMGQWYTSRRRSAIRALVVLMNVAVLAGCASVAPATAARTADSGSPVAGDTAISGDHGKPLLGCTHAQQSSASGNVHVLTVISGQTVHVTVGERIDLAETWAPIRPDGTGVGKVSLWAGQQVLCQSGDVEGRFTGIGGEPGQRIPLIIVQAGHAKVEIVQEYEEGNSPVSGVIYIDATAGKAAG